MRHPLPKTLGFTILCALPLAAAEATSPLSVALEAVPATTLPSIPVTLRMTFTNPGETAVAMPEHAILIATNDAGETFPVRWEGRLISPLGFLREEPIPAPSTVVVEARCEGNLLQHNWFADPRLHRTGRYQLQVIVGRFSGEQATIPEQGIRSSVAALQVTEPTGVDLAIWRQMQTLKNGSWRAGYLFTEPGISFATRVLAETPYAQYAGWFAATGIGERSTGSADALRAWLSQASHDQYTEWRELRLALFENGAAREWTGIKKEEVQRHLRNAQGLTAKLKASTNQEIATRATELLKVVADLEDIDK